MVIPRDFFYLIWIKIWRKLVLFLHLTDSKLESCFLAARDICTPSLCIVQDRTTSLMYSNLHSLADHILLMYKDTQACCHYIYFPLRIFFDNASFALYYLFIFPIHTLDYT